MKIANICGRRVSRAFSIIEALLSLIVLLIAMLGLLSLVPWVFGQVQSNSLEIQAYTLAQQYMDQVRLFVQAPLTYPLPSPTTAPISTGSSYVNGALANPTGDVFSIQQAPASQCGASVPNSLETCIVQVSWTDRGLARTIAVFSSAIEQQ